MSRILRAALGAAVGLAMAVAALPPRFGPRPHAPSAPAHAQPGGHRSPCGVRVGKTAAPPTVTLGAEATVVLTSTTDCPPQLVPLHVVLSIDGSNSMIPQGKLDAAKRAAVQFAQKMDYTHSRVGVTSFSDKAYVETDLTDKLGQVTGAIMGIDTELGTVIGAGIQLSTQMLNRARRDVPADLPPPIEVMVVLSDGRPWPETAAEVRAAANAARGQGILVIGICVGNDCDTVLMRSIVSRGDLYFDVRSAGRLVAVFEKIVDELQRTQLRRFEVRDVLPANMAFVPDSAEPPVDAVAPDPDGGGQVLTWRWNVVPQDGLTITYRVRPLDVGRWPTNVEARAVFRDTENRVGEAVFPVPSIAVVAPTPTATATPSATPTPAPSASPTAPAAATATVAPPRPSPSDPAPAATVRPLYLPLALREACDPRLVPADVVLAIDVSSSMDAPTSPGGPTKRAAAVAAARTFVVIGGPRGDRLGVVAFADEAVTVAPLGMAAAEIDARLDTLPTATGTDVAAGLTLALAEATGPAHRPGHPSAIVVLTDGRPTRGVPGAPRDAARAAAAAGVAVYAVGVGDDVDAALLADLAGAPDRWVVAPEAAALDRIYAALALRIPCPPEQLWRGRAEAEP